MSKNKTSYKDLNDQLESIMEDLNDEATDLDEAIEKYEKANKIIAEIEKYLEQSENTIKKLKKPVKSK